MHIAAICLGFLKLLFRKRMKSEMLSNKAAGLNYLPLNVTMEKCRINILSRERGTELS